MSALAQAQQDAYDKVVANYLPEVLSARLIDAGRPSAHCLLSFGEAGQQRLQTALEEGKVSVDTACGRLDLRVESGPARTMLGHQTQLRLSHLPEDRMVEGVTEHLLLAAGYKAGEFQVTHERLGERPAGFAAHGL